jgi:hypothetical protein
MGGLAERANPVAFSVPGQRSALPSVAVTDDGRVFVMYDTFDGTRFHVWLTESDDQGLTFTTVELYNFIGAGIPIANGNRLLGDYQFLEALGNTVYGTFSARGNVVDPLSGINTTDKDVPFFFATSGIFIPEPSTLVLLTISGGMLWVRRRLGKKV